MTKVVTTAVHWAEPTAVSSDDCWAACSVAWWVEQRAGHSADSTAVHWADQRVLTRADHWAWLKAGYWAAHSEHWTAGAKVACLVEPMAGRSDAKRADDWAARKGANWADRTEPCWAESWDGQMADCLVCRRVGRWVAPRAALWVWKMAGWKAGKWDASLAVQRAANWAASLVCYWADRKVCRLAAL